MQKPLRAQTNCFLGQFWIRLGFPCFGSALRSLNPSMRGGDDCCYLKLVHCKVN